jgi:hypothetical protein
MQIVNKDQPDSGRLSLRRWATGWRARNSQRRCGATDEQNRGCAK